MTSSTPTLTVTTTACGVQVQTSRDLGLTFVTPLTRCCSAVATGVSVTADCPTGVACKGCGATLAEAWAASDAIALEQAVAERGCPEPQACTDWTLHQATSER